MGALRFSIEVVVHPFYSTGRLRKTSMPIIDVSQNSYRSLVRAAHKRGMSIDRFIQNSLENDSELDQPSETVEPNKAVPTAELPPTPIQFAPAEPTSGPRRAIQQPNPPNDPNPAFNALWGRIENSAGEAISTKRGQDFTYEVDSGYLTVVGSGARIPRSQFKKALGQWPQRGPSNMRGIYAASVVWAVLADERIISDAA